MTPVCREGFRRGFREHLEQRPSSISKKANFRRFISSECHDAGTCWFLPYFLRFMLQFRASGLASRLRLCQTLTALTRCGLRLPLVRVFCLLVVLNYLRLFLSWSHLVNAFS